uniref:Putative ovule protein n=1 Tax=Solanum chacoense TaxID=4108 RepID=A0A0V0H4L1_SOLCH
MHLSSLTEIGINDFGIKTLPDRFGNLTSLETLELVRCRRLQHLDFLDAMPKFTCFLKLYLCTLTISNSTGALNNNSCIATVALKFISFCRLSFTTRAKRSSPFRPCLGTEQPFPGTEVYI